MVLDRMEKGDDYVQKSDATKQMDGYNVKCIEQVSEGESSFAKYLRNSQAVRVSERWF